MRALVHIALTIADLNGLGILSYDIQNAYLTAECRENIWAHSGPEFGSDAGTIMIVKMAICGLKSSGAVFYAHLAEAFNEIGFLSTNAEPDVWYQPAVKPNDFEYYEYILCYVDDILCISHEPGIALRRVHAVFRFKGDKMEHPKIYPGDQVGKMIVYGEEG